MRRRRRRNPPAAVVGLLTAPAAGLLTEEAKALRKRYLGPHGSLQPRVPPRAPSAINPSPRRRRPKSGGFDEWQPDLFGGAYKERAEGRNRDEQMDFARQEMRDSGSPSLFEWLEGKVRENPGVPPLLTWAALGGALLWLWNTHAARQGQQTPGVDAPGDGGGPVGVALPIPPDQRLWTIDDPIYGVDRRRAWPLGSSTG